MNGNSLSVLLAENRTLEFHTHENSDELFCVLEGAFEIETEDGLFPLKAGELAVVPRGTRHRPVVRERCKCLLAEFNGTLNYENCGGELC